MARRRHSSSDEDTDRRIPKSTRRYSPSGSGSPKSMDSSDSDSNRARERGHGPGKVRRGGSDSSSDDDLRRRRGRKDGGREEFVDKKRDKERRERRGGDDYSSDEDVGRRDRRVRERRDVGDRRRGEDVRKAGNGSGSDDESRRRGRKDGESGGDRKRGLEVIKERNGSSSDEEVGRRRGREDGERGGVSARKRGLEVIKERNDSSSDEEVERRRGRKDGERGGVGDRKSGLEVIKERNDSSSDEEVDRRRGKEVGEIGDVDDKQRDMEDGELSDRAEDVGRGKKRERGRKERISGREKEREYDSDDSRKIGDRRKENGREDRERASGRGKEMDGGEGDRSFRERDDEKRGEQHRTGMGKDDNGHNRNGKRAGKDSSRTLEDEDEKDDRKDKRAVNGRDDVDSKRHRRTDDGNRDGDRKDKDDGRKERRRDDGNRHGDREEKDDGRKERRRSDGNRHGDREDKDDGRKERRRDDGNRHGGREDKDDGRKERRNDRDRETRRDYNDEKDRRRSDGEDRRNVRTEVERDNKSGREREEGGGIVREDPRAQRPDGNLNMDMANLGRSGGVYIPPFKLARMLKEVEDKSSTEYQRMTWDALRKSINGLVNKVNSTNAKNIIPELFAENLIRGRGLFCRSCMKSQMASPGFTDVFSALVAVVNTKFPEVGDLLLRRIILQLQRAFKRNDKPQLLAAVKFIAHLVNQQVVHELIALELLTLLLRDPTDDSVEVAVGFVTECGAMLQDLSPRGLHAIFERFRGILHEGEIDKRVQFLIEGLFALRKAKFQNYPAVRPELDLVELEDQITHEISLSAEIDPEISLDIFKPDPQFLENEKRYEDLKKQILGEESEEDDDDDDESGAESDEDSEEDSEEEDEEQMRIRDETETNLVNLRRTIYLTIMSSVDFEEAGHKLLKIKLEPGQEMELCIMLLECCSQERTYLRYYGLLGQRFCMINKVHQENFEKCFVQQYSMIHRLETNKLRNVAKFFAHLLGTDALPWHVLAYIRLTEEDTTSSSRIFIKILFQELSEHLGIRLLNERLTDPSLQESFDSIFPKDNPKNTRFAINFFTSIGLGGITENLREYLKNMPRLIMQQQKPQSESEEESSGSDSSDSGSSSSSSSSESDSESERDNRKKRRRR